MRTASGWTVAQNTDSLLNGKLWIPSEFYKTEDWLI